MEEHQIDCRGLPCPVPIVRISQTMKKLSPGQVLQVEADDPAFPADIRAWADVTGHELITLDEGPVMTARLKCHA